MPDDLSRLMLSDERLESLWKTTGVLEFATLDPRLGLTRGEGSARVLSRSEHFSRTGSGVPAAPPSGDVAGTRDRSDAAAFPALVDSRARVFHSYDDIAENGGLRVIVTVPVLHGAPACSTSGTYAPTARLTSGPGLGMRRSHSFLTTA